MNQQAQAISHDLVTLADDVRALVAATADAAEDKIKEARERLMQAIENGGKFIDRVEEKAAEGARYTDQAVRERPYQTVAIAFGIGALIGHIATHR